MSGVPCAPHDPDGGTGQSASESKHLNTRVTFEGVGRNDTVLDSIGGTSTNSDGTDHLKNGTQDHGLTVSDRARRDGGSPSVGNIVWSDC